MTIQTELEAAKISRYYANTYDEARQSDVLDNRLFATIGEQKAYFAKREKQYRDSLHGHIISLRVLYTERLKTATTEEKPAIEALIKSLEKELAR